MSHDNIFVFVYSSFNWKTMMYSDQLPVAPIVCAYASQQSPICGRKDVCPNSFSV